MTDTLVVRKVMFCCVVARQLTAVLGAVTVTPVCTINDTVALCMRPRWYL